MCWDHQQVISIKLDRYVDLFLEANPNEVAPPSALESSAHSPIWVIGAAEAGSACFTCITASPFHHRGNAVPTSVRQVRSETAQ